jgi:hypothetical protein
VKPGPRYLFIVFALAGDSTTTTAMGTPCELRKILAPKRGCKSNLSMEVAQKNKFSG